MKKYTNLCAYSCTILVLTILLMGSGKANAQTTDANQFHEYDFGGMWSNVSGLDKNPATGKGSCPAGYEQQKIYGRAGRAGGGIDPAIWICVREHVEGRDSLYDFGGMYGYIDGKPSDPYKCEDDSFISQQLIGFEDTNYPLFVCYRPHTKGNIKGFKFGGTSSYQFKNPLATLYPSTRPYWPAECPVIKGKVDPAWGETIYWAKRVYGSSKEGRDFDEDIYVCIAAPLYEKLPKISNLVPKVSNGKIDLTWDFSPGVDFYRISRTPAELNPAVGVNYTSEGKLAFTRYPMIRVVTGGKARFTDTNVINGVEYTYTIIPGSIQGVMAGIFGNDIIGGVCCTDLLTRITLKYEVPSASPNDTEVPTTPSNIIATPVSSGQIDVTWSASTDNIGVTGYKIYRNGTYVGTVSGTSFNDIGLNPDTSYTYSVSAFDRDLNSSDRSSEVTAKTGRPSGSNQNSVIVFPSKAKWGEKVVISGQGFALSQDNEVTLQNASGGNIPVGVYSSNGSTIRVTLPTTKYNWGNYKLYVVVGDKVKGPASISVSQ